MSYVTALHLYRIKLGTKLLRSLRLLQLGQGRSLYGGGGGDETNTQDRARQFATILCSPHAPWERLVENLSFVSLLESVFVRAGGWQAEGSPWTTHAQ